MIARFMLFSGHSTSDPENSFNDCLRKIFKFLHGAIVREKQERRKKKKKLLIFHLEGSI